MSLLLVMILLRKCISTTSKICVINMLKLLLPLTHLCNHIGIACDSTHETPSITLAMLPIFIFIFFFCSSCFRNHRRAHHCKLGDILFPLPIDPHVSVSLTLLSSGCVEEGRGIHDSLAHLANLIASSLSE